MPISRRSLAAAALALVLPLSACGSGGDDGGPTDASGKVEGDITFQTWNLRANFKPCFEDLIADFGNTYPGTHVKWIDQPAEGYPDKLSADAAGGTLPDVVNVSPDLVAPLARAGLAPRPRQGRRHLPVRVPARRLGQSPDTGHEGAPTPSPGTSNTGPLLLQQGPLREGRARSGTAAEDVRRPLLRRPCAWPRRATARSPPSPTCPPSRTSAATASR